MPLRRRASRHVRVEAAARRQGRVRRCAMRPAHAKRYSQSRTLVRLCAFFRRLFPPCARIRASINIYKPAIIIVKPVFADTSPRRPPLFAPLGAVRPRVFATFGFQNAEKRRKIVVFAKKSRSVVCLFRSFALLLHSLSGKTRPSEKSERGKEAQKEDDL